MTVWNRRAACNPQSEKQLQHTGKGLRIPLVTLVLVDKMLQKDLSSSGFSLFEKCLCLGHQLIRTHVFFAGPCILGGLWCFSVEGFSDTAGSWEAPVAACSTETDCTEADCSEVGGRGWLKPQFAFQLLGTALKPSQTKG